MPLKERESAKFYYQPAAPGNNAPSLDPSALAWVVGRWSIPDLTTCVPVLTQSSMGADLTAANLEHELASETNVINGEIAKRIAIVMNS